MLRHLLLFALAMWLSSCNESGFGGLSGSGERVRDDGGEDEEPIDAKPRRKKKIERTAKGDHGDPDDGDVEDAGPVGEEGDILSKDEATCLLSKGDDFRIVFLLDRSGSTEETDPQNVRKEASLRLIDNFTDFITHNPNTNFRVSMVGFHGGPGPRPFTWLDLKTASREDVEKDVTLATSSCRGGWRGSGCRRGTFFMEAFEEAEKLFAQAGASASEERTRNYIVFLSDGEANGPNDNVPGLTAKVNAMANQIGIAIYSIQIGPGNRFNSSSKLDSVELMRALAVPTTGIVGSEHVGTYVHARDPSAIDGAFTDFYKWVTTCP